jgi:hypothetical protein
MRLGAARMKNNATQYLKEKQSEMIEGDSKYE